MKLYSLLMIFFLQSMACVCSAQGALSIQINPVFKEKALVLQDKMYRTENGDSVSIETFKFYMSALKLIEGKNQFLESNSYHLINMEDSNSLFIKLENIQEGHYSSFEFNIGVDSEASVSGALGGDLDPTLGMYWAWNTGYINAKLIGHSPSCKKNHHEFEFHIGGYKEPYVTLRKVSIKNANLDIKKGLTSKLELNADISTWFTGIHLTSLNSVVIPSLEALKIADNYMEMFSLADPSRSSEK